MAAVGRRKTPAAPEGRPAAPPADTQRGENPDSVGQFERKHSLPSFFVYFTVPSSPGLWKRGKEEFGGAQISAFSLSPPPTLLLLLFSCLTLPPSRWKRRTGEKKIFQLLNCFGGFFHSLSLSLSLWLAVTLMTAPRWTGAWTTLSADLWPASAAAPPPIQRTRRQVL